MTDGRWRFAAASSIGTSHAKLEAPCQDANACVVLQDRAGQPVLIAVVADGAGSARRGELGAGLACALIVEEARGLLATEGSIQALTRSCVEGWLARLRVEIETQATHEGAQRRDFACTLVAAVVGVDRAVFFQVGDGGIVVSSPEEGDDYAWVFWPGTGEYENVTFFATEPEAMGHLEWDSVDRRIDEVALFSDGLQRLVLHYQSRTAHAPFFRSKFAVMRAADQAEAEALSAKLEAFLSSAVINDRTDDDKTLILATRRPADTSHEEPQGLR